MRWMLANFCRRGGAIKHVFPWAISRDHSCVFLTNTQPWWRWVTVVPLHNCLTVQAAVPQTLRVGWEKRWHWLPHLHCLPGLSHCVFVNTPFHSRLWKFQPSVWFRMLFSEIFLSNDFQQLFGIFSFQVLWVVPVHFLFKRDPVTSRNVELKGPESLQQEFILELNKSSRKERKWAAHQELQQVYPNHPTSCSQGNPWAVAELPEEATLTSRFCTAQGLVL